MTTTQKPYSVTLQTFAPTASATPPWAPPEKFSGAVAPPRPHHPHLSPSTTLAPVSPAPSINFDSKQSFYSSFRPFFAEFRAFYLCIGSSRDCWHQQVFSRLFLPFLVDLSRFQNFARLFCLFELCSRISFVGCQMRFGSAVCLFGIVWSEWGLGCFGNCLTPAAAPNYSSHLSPRRP